jgi:diaminopimelate decarboxylase
LLVDQGWAALWYNQTVRLPGFTYRDQQLHCAGLSLAALARRFGTPLYVYSAEYIRRRFRAFDRAFHTTPHTLCYSVKANSNLGILRLLRELGAGFDVVSRGELARILKVDRGAARHTVFSGVGKTAAEMDAALRAGILLFNVESEGELHVLAARAAHARKRARVALRVNPDVTAETHPYISTGLREHKFGVPIGEARRLYALAQREKWLEPAGVSVHIGSQILAVEPFGLTMQRVAELVRQLRSDGHTIRYVDAGGGLGIPYEPEGRSGHYFDDYARAILRPLKGMKVRLLLEPGRAIVGPAGALLTRVLYLKRNGAKRFAVTDAAMNDLIRPALYGAYHEIVAVQEQTETDSEVVDVVGPVCETGDFFARDRRLPTLHEGDLLAVLDAGAYGMSLASNYNTRPRAAEVLVDGRRARRVRRRESLADLLRGERP